MKVLKNIEELAGKTIKNAVMLNNDETFGILFTDDTYCSIDVRFYGESHELKFNGQGEICESELKALGVVDHEAGRGKKQTV